jgi:hypothetical protein
VSRMDYVNWQAPTRLGRRINELRRRYFDRRELWRLAVERQDLNDAHRHKTMAHRLLMKANATEARAISRGDGRKTED